MKEFVVGFLFSPDNKHVLLIKKNRPDWQKGLLNGISGHVEPGESARNAMIREFFEEAGVVVKDWKQFCELAESTGNWRVTFYLSNCEKAWNEVRTQTDEVIFKLEVDNLDGYKMVKNLNWLIPLAMDEFEPVAKIHQFDMIAQRKGLI